MQFQKSFFFNSFYKLSFLDKEWCLSLCSGKSECLFKNFKHSNILTSQNYVSVTTKTGCFVQPKYFFETLQAYKCLKQAKRLVKAFQVSKWLDKLRCLSDDDSKQCRSNYNIGMFRSAKGFASISSIQMPWPPKVFVGVF